MLRGAERCTGACSRERSRLYKKERLSNPADRFGGSPLLPDLPLGHRLWSGARRFSHKKQKRTRPRTRWPKR